MVDRLVSVDSVDNRLPDVVRQRLADDMADPATTEGAVLSAIFVGLLAVPEVSAPLLITTPVTIKTDNVFICMGQNPATGRLYGNSSANGHYGTSDDGGVTWADRSYSPVTYTPSPTGYAFDAVSMFAYSSTGRVWRAPLDVFNGWTEITPLDVPVGTTGRPGSLLALGSGVLLYGNYNASAQGAGVGAHLWRSTDSGATWAHVLDAATARHIHAVRKSPNTGFIWCSVGDFGWGGFGLYRSEDDGVTWTFMSSNGYGIDMVFSAATDRRPDLIVLEGDGLNRPHLLGFYENAEPGALTFPLVWFTGAPSDAASTRGTARGIGMTAQGDVVYFITTEGGTVGTKAGLYVAQWPDFTRSVLLKDTTGAEPVAYLASFPGADAVLNHRSSFPVPTFAR